MCTTSFILLAILAQASPLTADPQAKAQAQELLGQAQNSTSRAMSAARWRSSTPPTPPTHRPS